MPRASPEDLLEVLFLQPPLHAMGHSLSLQLAFNSDVLSLDPFGSASLVLSRLHVPLP